MAVQEGDYGMVEVIKGKHKGKIGYYDDVADDGKAIVYFGRPFESEYYRIPHSFLIKTEKRNLEIEEWVRDNPENARKFGIRIIPLPVIDHEGHS